MENSERPAFHVPESISMQGDDGHGLTKREYFAAMAMQGLRAGKLLRVAGDALASSKIWTSEQIAKAAVEDADALLAELAKPIEP